MENGSAILSHENEGCEALERAGIETMNMKSRVKVRALAKSRNSI